MRVPVLGAGLGGLDSCGLLSNSTRAGWLKPLGLHWLMDVTNDGLACLSDHGSHHRSHDQNPGQADDPAQFKSLLLAV
jgi:hypothetical protein